VERPHFDLRYLLPNFFTALSIFVGVISMIASIKGEFEKAAWLIFLSLLLDGLDGRVARWTNSCSKFGIEFDSLADIVAFGVAPALLLYQSIGHHYGKFGTLVSALFVVFGAIRLARFNVMAPTSEPSVFIGIPIPTAAISVAGWVLLYLKYGWEDLQFPILLFALGISLLMVSNIRYPSFKKFSLQRNRMVRSLTTIIIFLAILYLYPAEAVTLLITIYIFSGIIRAIYFLSKRRRKGE